MAILRPRVRALLSIVPLMTLASCGGGNSNGGVGPELPFDLGLFIQGTVSDGSDDPVFGVTLRVTTYQWNGQCTNVMFGPVNSLTVNELGRFSATLGYGRGEDDVQVCLTVEAIPPSGSNLAGEVRSAIRAEVRPLEDGLQLVEVDFVLSPNP